jgi:drug/metabolite transporter (DMT)-like permease
MFLGFIAWYRGLSLGGVARIGQIQLLQPFLTILASALFLGEHLSVTTLGFAAGVVVCVALGRRTQIGNAIN